MDKALSGIRVVDMTESFDHQQTDGNLGLE
jgi:hypothetical protein